MANHKDLLFPAIEPFNQGFLKVSNIHKLYFEESGNPKGIPLLVLHGGPGEGSSAKTRQRYNPKKFHIIQFDQRGCGQSTPNAELEENTTAHLVADIEKLRQHLGVDKWWVTGASWGSTLALVYTIEHAKAVLGLVLNGIFLGYKVNVDWVHGPSGAARIFPEAYDDYINFLPEELRENPLQAHYNLMLDADKDKAYAAAVNLLVYEGKILNMAENTLEKEQERFEAEKLMTDEEKAEALEGFEKFAYQHSLLESHYSLNDYFLPEGYILDNVDKIAHLPITLIHGRYDMVCPIKNAYKLSQYLLKSGVNVEYIVVENAAHSTSEMLPQVMSVLDKIKLV